METYLKAHGIEAVTPEIEVKGMPGMKVGVLHDKNKMLSGDLVPKIVSAFRDIYGHSAPVDDSSWGEYLKCSDCSNTLSIEDYYQLSEYRFLRDIESENPLDAENCSCCGGAMELFWNPQEQIQSLQELFSKKALALAVLLGEDGNVYGFEYGWPETLGKAWDDVVKKLCINNDVGLDSFGSDFEQAGIQFHDEVMHLVEVGQVYPSRKGGSFFNLLGTFLNDAISEEQRKLPAITATNKNVNAYGILKVAEWEDVVESGNDDLVVLKGDIDLMAQSTQEKAMKSFFRFYRQRKS